jgi:recombination protein RecA
MAEDKFEKLFNIVKKEAEKADTAQEIFKGNDLFGLSSRVTFGVPTGIPQLDFCLGARGGYPAGKVVELYGMPMSGKTTAAYHAIAEVQKIGGYALFIDTEQSYDAERAIELGVDPERLFVASADTIEDTFILAETTLMGRNKLGMDGPFIVVVDSITGVPTKEEFGKTMNESQKIGEEAKQIRRGARRIISLCAHTKTIMLFINHAVATITMYGKPSKAAGGNALKFYGSIRVEFNQSSAIKDEENKDRRLGEKVNVTVEKVKGSFLEYNKFSVNLMNKGGYDKLLSLYEAMLLTGMLSKPKNARAATLMMNGEPTETQIKEEDFLGLVEQFGGYDAAYKAWVEDATARGVMRLWGK